MVWPWKSKRKNHCLYVAGFFKRQPSIGFVQPHLGRKLEIKIRKFVSAKGRPVFYTRVSLQRNFLVIVRCSKGIQVFASITAYNPAWFSTDPSEKLWSQKMDVGHKFFPPLLLQPAPCHDDIHLYHTPILVRSDNGIGWQCWLRQVKSYIGVFWELRQGMLTMAICLTFNEELSDLIS